MAEGAKNTIKYVVVPCRRDKEGKIITSGNVTPYGYHHILKVEVGPDGIWYWPMAQIYCDYPEDRVMEITKMLAGDAPIETDYNFYTKIYSKDDLK